MLSHARSMPTETYHAPHTHAPRMHRTRMHCTQDDGWTPGNPSRTADSGAKGEHEVQALKKEVQEAMNALNREYMKKTQELTNELAYRKVIDKLSATLGTEAFLHAHLFFYFLFLWLFSYF